MGAWDKNNPVTAVKSISIREQQLKQLKIIQAKCRILSQSEVINICIDEKFKRIEEEGK